MNSPRQIVRSFWSAIAKPGTPCGRSADFDASDEPLHAFELESRILYSASPLLLPQDIGDTGEIDLAEVHEDLSSFFTADSQAVAASQDDWFESLFPPATLFETDTAPEVETTSLELIFVDSAVNDYESLVADLVDREGGNRDFQVIMLDSSSDGIAQISDAMRQYSEVDAMHLVSHGNAGQVKLGNTLLTSDSLQDYSADFDVWNQSLKSGADLLIYGCELASNSDGKQLVETLGILTGADVAASVDDTGYAELGGDWDLEHVTGGIETAVAFSTEVQSTWEGRLATVTVETTADVMDGNTSSVANLLANKGTDGFISLREAVRATNNTSGADVIQLDADTYTLTITGGGGAGDLDILDDLTILGVSPTDTVLDGNLLHRVLEVHDNGNHVVSISNLKIQNGREADTDNLGGGIKIRGTLNTPVVTLENVWVTGNEVTGTDNAGGGIYTAGDLTITNSLIDGNMADEGGGVLSANSTLTMINTTVSGNTATIAGGGGGVALDGSSATLDFVTIAHNTDDGIHEYSDVTINVSSSIIANNSGNDVEASVNSSGFNIIGDTSGSGYVGSDLLNTDPNLSPTLADNAGPTMTHALLAGCPALDAANATGAPATDQRGEMRDGSPDIGAYEFVAAANSEETLATNDPLLLNEGATATITTSLLETTDAEQTPAQLIYTVTGVPASGTLLRSGTALAAGNTFTQDDIDNNRINYVHNGNEDFTDSFTFDVDDGTGNSTNDTFNITITPVNDNTPAADTESFTVLDGGTATEADLDAGTNLLDGDTDIDLPNDTLTVNTTPVVDVSFGSLTLNANGTFSYTHEGSENFTDTFTYEVTDALGNTDTATVTITITPVDNGLDVSVPGGQKTIENTDLVFSTANGNAISVDDGSPGDPMLRTTITVANGVLNLVTTAGLTSVTGDGTNSVIVIGIESAINTALDGLTFSPNGGFTGSASLQVATDLQADLLGYYQFTQPSPLGTDSSPAGGNDGTPSGPGAAPDPYTVFDGVRNSDVIVLDGVDDNIQIPGRFGTPSEVTIAAWVNVAAVNNQDVVSMGSISLRLNDVGNGVGVTGFYHDGTDWKHTDTLQFIGGDGWRHVAYTFDDANDTQAIYIDGVLLGTTSYSGSINWAHQPNSTIGSHANGSSYFLNGMLDEARVYDRALSVSEIQALANDQNTDTELVSITVTPNNVAPTFTTLTNPVDSTNEDIEVEVSFADLVSAGNENDVDGSVNSFVVKSVSSGTLKLGTTAGSATAWSAGVNDSIDATNNAYWTPDLDVTGTQNAFEVVAKDDGGLESTSNVTAQISVTPVNDKTPVADPESFTVSEGGTASESDLDVGTSLLDGDTDLDLPNDTLTVNTTPVVDASYGTLTLNSNGTFSYTHNGSENFNDSFTYEVTDALGNSDTATVTITITPVNDPPQVDLNGSDGSGIDYSTSFKEGDALVAVADTDATISDVDHTTHTSLTITLTGVLNGTEERIRIGGKEFKATDSKTDVATVGSTDFQVDYNGTDFVVTRDGGGLMAETDLQSLIRSISYENRDDDSLDGIRTFAFVLQDAAGANSSVSTTTINVGPVNDPPTLTTFAAPVETTDEETEVEISLADLKAQGDEADVDGTVDAFVVKSVATGTLKIGTSAATATVWTLGSNDTIDASNHAYWTSDLEAFGAQNAFEVVANDNNSAESVGNVMSQISVTPVNDNTPVADTESFTVLEGGTATDADLDAGTSLLDGDTDIDLPNDTLTVNTTPIVDVSYGTLSLNADGTFSYTHNGTENFTDSFTYEVSDAVGNKDTATVTITITPVNDNTPVADNESFTVLEGGTATDADLDAGTNLLDGDAEIDLPNDTLTVNTTPVVDVSYGTLMLNANGTFSYTHDGSENFSDSFNYEVSDALGNNDTATVTITITPVNDNTPVADTESFTVLEGGTATEADLDAGTSLLDGDTDIDLPNDTLTVNTMPVVDTSYGFLTLNANGTFSYVHDGSENFADSFTYEVFDALGNNDTATVTISITPVNEAPFAITPTGFNVNENTDTSSGKSLGTFTTTDPDAGETFSYAIVGGADATKFSVGGSDSDELLLTDGILNFETKPSYSATVRVTDSGGNSYDETLTVNVGDLNEPPTDIAPNSLSINENTDTSGGYSVGMLTTTDEDGGETFTYTIVGGTDQTKFTIGGVGNDELLLTDGNLDFETQSSYSVIVRVTDSGSNTYDETITVNVGDLNETPTDIAPNSLSVNENIDTSSGYSVGTLTSTDEDGGETFTYSVVGGADEANFSIGGTAGDELILTDGTLNFESQSSYSVIVRVTDSFGNTYNETLSINVNDLNETPTDIAPNSVSISENSDTSSGTSLGTLTTTDPETGETFSYSIVGGTDAVNFSIGGLSGDELILNDGVLDFESKASYSVIVRVTDSDNNTHDETLTVNINDLNEAPTAITPTSFSVNENTDSSSGYSLGVINVSDEDSPESFSYSIFGGTDAGKFSIGGTGSNELILTDGAVDYESQSSYSVIVRVTDSSGNTYDETITVAVNDINEPASVSLLNPVTSLAENTNTASAIKMADIIVTDDAMGTNTLALTGADAAKFEIVGGNELYLKAGTTLDFESLAAFNVTVTIDDVGISGSPDDTESLSVSILDVNEAPTASDDVYHMKYSLATSVGSVVGVLNNDLDPDGNPLTVALKSGPAHGSLTLNSDGSFVYTPDPGFYGTDGFTYQIDDGNALTSIASVELVVDLPGISPPAPTSGGGVTVNDDGETVDVTTTDSKEESTEDEITAVEFAPTGGPSGTSETPTAPSESEEPDTLVSQEIISDSSFDEAMELLSLETESRDNNSGRAAAKSNETESIEGEVLAETVPDFIFSAWDEIRQEVDNEHLYKQMAIGSTLALSTSLSIGYVIWLIRGGILLSSVLSSMPAWRMIDPLPVLGLDDIDGDDDDESLESLVTASNSGQEPSLEPGFDIDCDAQEMAVSTSVASGQGQT